ncbi:hypothetical protein LXT12_23555 [Pelomonas sp. P7]|uniref:SmpA / OmlA family protein n=1 Tax=Pelomonas caseinilytica TaxID=2906763 RepID=A0ABS8XKZ4_9BURK|nr:hypothetical protein [Pelomonas sp. P7]MCE4540232.1 hypothetical protein [Pelomonas sp. P7]
MNARALLALLPLPALALLLMAGCATAPVPAPAPTPAPASPPAPAARPAASAADLARRAEFDAALNRWHGASLTELQAKLGKPTAVTRGNAGRTTYAFTRTTTDPASGLNRFSCTVRYVVDDKTRVVQSHQIEGC